MLANAPKTAAIDHRKKDRETAEFQKKQMEEARMRDAAYSTLQKAQGHLWSEEHLRQRLEDHENKKKKIENQTHLRNFYKDQMNEKERSFVEQCGLNDTEMKFQSHLM